MKPQAEMTTPLDAREHLFRCTGCGREGFTAGGMAHHVCRPGKASEHGERSSEIGGRNSANSELRTARSGPPSPTTFGTLAGAATQNPKDTQDMISPDASPAATTVETAPKGKGAKKGKKGKAKPAAAAPAEAGTTNGPALRDPAKLKPHPLFEKTHHPMMPKDSPQWAALVESVRDHGVLEEVMVTSDGLVVDGRHRVAAAVEAELKEIRVTVVDGAAAPMIIASTLIHRRHYSKSARAYLVAPFAEEAVEASERLRRAKVSANLLQNSRPAQKLGSSEEGSATPLQKFSQELGIGLEYLRHGRDVHARLEKVGKIIVEHPDTKEKMTVRERVEDLLFNEATSFQPVLAMLGYLAAGNIPEGQKLKDQRAEYGRLAKEKLKSLTANFRTWDTCNAVEKEELYQAIPKEVPQWPLDVAQRLYTELSKRRDEWMGKS